MFHRCSSVFSRSTPKSPCLEIQSPREISLQNPISTFHFKIQIWQNIFKKCCTHDCRWINGNDMNTIGGFCVDHDRYDLYYSSQTLFAFVWVLIFEIVILLSVSLVLPVRFVSWVLQSNISLSEQFWVSEGRGNWLRRCPEIKNE